MLLVDFQNNADNLAIRLEGRLVGEFAEEVRDLVLRGNIRRKVIINVSEVTFVDAVGEAVLSWLKRIGAEFVAETLYAQHICERLRLPLAVQCNAQSKGKQAKKQASSHELFLRDIVETESELSSVAAQKQRGLGTQFAERGEQDARPRAPSPSEPGAAEQNKQPHPARDTTDEAFRA